MDVKTLKNVYIGNELVAAGTVVHIENLELVQTLKAKGSVGDADAELPEVQAPAVEQTQAAKDQEEQAAREAAAREQIDARRAELAASEAAKQPAPLEGASDSNSEGLQQADPNGPQQPTEAEIAATLASLDESKTEPQV